MADDKSDAVPVPLPFAAFSGAVGLSDDDEDVGEDSEFSESPSDAPGDDAVFVGGGATEFPESLHPQSISPHSELWRKADEKRPRAFLESLREGMNEIDSGEQC